MCVCIYMYIYRGKIQVDNQTDKGPEIVLGLESSKVSPSSFHRERESSLLTTYWSESALSS